MGAAIVHTVQRPVLEDYMAEAEAAFPWHSVMMKRDFAGNRMVQGQLGPVHPIDQEVIHERLQTRADVDWFCRLAYRRDPGNENENDDPQFISDHSSTSLELGSSAILTSD